jgi:hypothetical protein
MRRANSSERRFCWLPTPVRKRRRDRDQCRRGRLDRLSEQRFVLAPAWLLAYPAAGATFSNFSRSVSWFDLRTVSSSRPALAQ